MEEIIRLINAYWKFDNDQQHLSTWHDKQDLLEAIRQAKIWDKPAVSNIVGDERRVLLIDFYNMLGTDKFENPDDTEGIVDWYLRVKDN